MKIFLALVCLGSLSNGLALDDGVAIHRTIGDSKPEIYKVVVHEDRTASSEYFPEMEFVTDQQCTARIESAQGGEGDVGKADVNLSYKVDSEERDGPSDGIESEHKQVVLKGTLDKQGRLSFADEDAPLEDVLTRITFSPAETSVVVSFPDVPVKVGDKWEILIPTPAAKDRTPQKLTATFVGEKKAENRDALAVRINGEITFDTEYSMTLKLGSGNVDQTFLTKTTCEVQGDALVDKATGHTIRAKTELKKRTVTTIKSRDSETKLVGKSFAVISTTAG